MKKMLCTVLATATLVAFSTAGFAGDTTSAAGAELSLSVGNVDTTTNPLTYTPSPGVGLSVSTNETNFAITAANSLTDTENGMEYGTLSTSEGYAQRTKTTDVGTGPEATASPTALPGATWGWIGGS